MVADTPFETDELKILDDISLQIIKLKELFGAESLCLGPDFFSLRHFSTVYKTKLLIPSTLFYESGYERLSKNLIEKGLSPQDVDLIFCKNVKSLCF